MVRGPGCPDLGRQVCPVTGLVAIQPQTGKSGPAGLVTSRVGVGRDTSCPGPRSHSAREPQASPQPPGHGLALDFIVRRLGTAGALPFPKEGRLTHPQHPPCSQAWICRSGPQRATWPPSPELRAQQRGVSQAPSDGRDLQAVPQGGADGPRLTSTDEKAEAQSSTGACEVAEQSPRFMKGTQGSCWQEGPS